MATTKSNKPHTACRHMPTTKSNKPHSTSSLSGGVPPSTRLPAHGAGRTQHRHRQPPVVSAEGTMKRVHAAARILLRHHARHAAQNRSERDHRLLRHHARHAAQNGSEGSQNKEFTEAVKEFKNGRPSGSIRYTTYTHVEQSRPLSKSTNTHLLPDLGAGLRNRHDVHWAMVLCVCVCVLWGIA